METEALKYGIAAGEMQNVSPDRFLNDGDQLIFSSLPDAGILDAFEANEAFTGQPGAFADAIFAAIADATLSFAAREPDKASDYKRSGFKALWRMYADDQE